MSCGMLAFQKAGISVERYVAYEIDKYAIQTSQHNFLMIEQKGDVFGADFTQYEGFDAVIGGSPCTYWSIAQKNNRETEASGMGWELFSQYVRAIHEAKPRFFVYENNKSMSQAIRASIDEAFGFEAICINSARVSAQNRNRLYWVGVRNTDGTYSKANIKQPEDLGILLKDILECECFCVAERGRYAEDGSIEQRFEAREDGKSNVLTTVQKDNNIAEPVRIGCYPSPDGTLKNSQGMRLYSVDGKSVNLTAQGGGMGAKTGLYAIPVEFNENTPIKAISAADGKTYTVYEVKDGLIAIKGKQYPIKLPDGFYIIRKLTVRECMRLQTVPEWYEFPVSNSQAYKMLGNGWTVDVIAHILRGVTE